MSTVIDELGKLCAGLPDVTVQMQAADMLITVGLPAGRKQTLKIWSTRHASTNTAVISLQSRSAIVEGHKMVTEALRQNSRFTRAGFALDTSVTPPALDVICGLAINPQALPFQDFVDALYAVASLADHIESQTAHGADRF